MYPHDLPFPGFELSVWNLTFLIAIASGYPLLLASLSARLPSPLPRFIVARWLSTVYVSALGAQLFAYAFDKYTSFLPPPTVSWLAYYFNPLFSPKTLYGAILFLPLGAFLVSVPWRDLRYEDTLDCWTPPMFLVLGICRVGCFLQGCCYGVRSSLVGIPFPAGSPVFYKQVHEGLIEMHAATSLPVIPTQAISAFVLFGLSVYAMRRLSRARAPVFVDGVALYSVFRFLIELVRDDIERNVYGPFSTSQWLALAVLAAAAGWRWRMNRLVLADR